MENTKTMTELLCDLSSATAEHSDAIESQATEAGEMSAVEAELARWDAIPSSATTRAEARAEAAERAEIELRVAAARQVVAAAVRRSATTRAALQAAIAAVQSAL